MERAVLVALVVVVAGCTGPSPPDGDGPDDGGPAARSSDSWNWTTAPAPSIARGEAGCAATDGRIVLAGGFVDGPGNQVTSSTEVYDVDGRSWSDGPDLPVAVHHPQVAAVGGTFYVLGGYTGPYFTPTNTALAWSPGDDAWQDVAPLPIPRGAGGTAIVDGEIVLAGGVTTDQSLAAQVDVYDPSDDTWRQGPDLATPRDHLAVDTVGHVVVAANGRQQTFASNTDLVEIWNVTSGAWQEARSAPTARGGVGGTVWNRSMFVAGGEESGGTFDEVEAYDAADGSWTELPPMPTARHGLCVAATSQGVHTVTGGREPGFAVSDVHEVLVEDGSTG